MSGYAVVSIASRPPRKCITVGEGIVTFGVAFAVDFRKRKSSTKIGFGRASLPATCHEGGACSRVRFSVWNVTAIFEGISFTFVEPQQEVAMPGAAIVFAVGDDAQAEVFLHRHDIADRLFLNALQAPRSPPFGLLACRRSVLCGRIRLPT